MATTAAILEYIVTANTAQANAALAKTQGQLVTMGKTSKATGAKVAAGFAVVGVAAAASAAALFKVGEEFDKAFDKIETRTGATGKELKKLEGSFKKVVTTVPTDFDSAAEAVAGLNARLGQTGKPLTQLARQITALSKITGEDVGENVEAVTRLFGDWGVATKNQTETLDGLFRVSQKTGASVSDLARNMVQFGAPLRNLGFSIAESAALFGEFEKTGVNITTVLSGLRLSVGNFAKPSADLAKTMKDLNLSASDTPAAIVEMFKQIKTLGSESAATALAIDAFGKRAGPDLVDTIRGGKFELSELIKTFKDGDGTIRQTERRTRDFAEQWQLFVNNLKTAVEPLARDVFEGLSKMMKEVQRAFKEGGLEGILDLLVQKLSDAIPKIGAAGVKIAEALVKGFLDAGVWGHVALGAVIWKLLGGVKALTATAAAGATLGTRLAIGFKAGLARTGVGLGIVALFEALTTEGGIIDSIEGKGNSIGAHFVDGIEAGIGGQLEKAVNRKSIPLLQKHVDHVQDLIKVYEDAGDEVPADLRKMANAGERELDKMQASVAEAKQGIHRLRVGFHDDLGSIMKDTDRNMDLIRNSMDVNSKRGRAAIERNFNAATTAIERAMDQGLIGAQEGYRAIAALARKELGNYGIKGADAEKIILGAETDPNREGHHGFQIGGVIVPGYGTGDKVHALLEPGEVVWNKKAVAAMGGADKTNAVNSAIPRFQAGGMVDPAGPGTGVVNEAIAGIVGNWSQQYNAAINYGYDPGGGHQSPGHNITGTATDTGPAGGWAGESLALFERGLRAIEGGVDQILYGTAGIGTPYPGHGRFDHAHIEWGMHPNVSGLGGVAAIAGPVKIDLPRFEGATIIGSIAAAGLNRVAGGAEKVLAERVRAQQATAGRASTPGGTGAAVDVGPGALSRGEVNDLVKSVGLPNWFGWVALAESGLNPNATSYANAQGLWQILMPLHQGLVNQHGGNAYNPMTNALVAAELERQSGTTPWNPSKYDGFIPEGWGPHQGEPFKRGGIVKGFQEGGKILLVGDSITKMALDAGGFPGGWDHPGTVVGGETAQFFGESAVKNHWGDSDYAALAFMMGTNDNSTANLGPALNTVKGVIGKAGLSLMTVPSGSTNQEAKNRMILGFGANAIADIGGVPLSDGLHPTSPEGIATFRQRIKDAGNKAKKAMKGGGGGGSNGGGGGEETAAASDLSSAGMSFGEWVQSVLGDGSKGTQGLSERVRKAIKQTTDNITLWDAVIGGQEIRDAMSTSEAGSEMGPLERANQIVMNENLLMVLKAMKAWLLEGLKTPRLKPTARTRLEELLEGIQGVRGSKTGRLLDVEAHLDELRNPDTSNSMKAENDAAQVELLAGLLRDEKLRTAVSQAQYKVFSEFAGGFAAGGYIPSGQWGVVGESGPEVVGGPMSVSPMGGTTVIINGDIVNTPPGKQPVEVQGAKAIVQQGSRGYGRRPLGSARGY